MSAGVSSGGFRITVRFFAIFRELAGAAEREYQVVPGSTAGDLIDRVAQGWQGGDALLAGWVAVNRRYVAPEHVLSDGDELALIPPVAGG